MDKSADQHIAYIYPLSAACILYIRQRCKIYAHTPSRENKRRYHTMRMLMIAPQPFFEPRGAPLCVNQHIQALLELGYEIDLITYPLGQNLSHPNLHIYR